MTVCRAALGSGVSPNIVATCRALYRKGGEKGCGPSHAAGGRANNRYGQGARGD